MREVFGLPPFSSVFNGLVTEIWEAGVSLLLLFHTLYAFNFYFFLLLLCFLRARISFPPLFVVEATALSGLSEERHGLRSAEWFMSGFCHIPPNLHG